MAAFHADCASNVCDHSGETCERPRSGYLYDTPQGVTDLLCADCGVTLLADVEPQEEG